MRLGKRLIDFALLNPFTCTYLHTLVTVNLISYSIQYVHALWGVGIVAIFRRVLPQNQNAASDKPVTVRGRGLMTLNTHLKSKIKQYWSTDVPIHYL